MAILLKTLPKEITDLIYDKQRDFTKEKARKVNLEQTIIRLLKDAYLSEKKKTG